MNNYGKINYYQDGELLESLIYSYKPTLKEAEILKDLRSFMQNVAIHIENDCCWSLEEVHKSFDLLNEKYFKDNMIAIFEDQ